MVVHDSGRARVLRNADHLEDSPRSAEELAEAAGVTPRPLYRLLRALAGVGVFARDADGRFQLNPPAEPLREGGPVSLRAPAVRIGEEQDRRSDDLFETVRTRETAFDRPVEHPGQARIFDAAMTGFSGRAMLDAMTSRASRPWPTSAAASGRIFAPPRSHPTAGSAIASEPRGYRACNPSGRSWPDAHSPCRDKRDRSRT
jgi:hypothetical protein